MLSNYFTGVRSFGIVAVIAAVGAALATGAFAGAGATKRLPEWPISAFAHPLQRAHSEGAGPAMPLRGVSGVSLAAVRGNDEIYIGHRYGPTTLDCFWEHFTPQGGGGGCGKANIVEAQGMVSVSQAGEGPPNHILAFVPDGVRSMVVRDGDGSSHAVQVANNLAVYEDLNNPSSVSFALPNGVTRTTNVAAWVIPPRPGAPGSSE
jgi:hypothetical protein